MSDQLDARWEELRIETQTWPEVDRIHHVRAEMNKVCAVIQSQHRAAEIAAHEARFGRNAPRAKGRLDA